MTGRNGALRRHEAAEGSAASGPDGQPVVAMTRPDDGGRFATMLQDAGCRVLHTPLTRVVPPTDPGALQAAARRLVRQEEGKGTAYDVLLLTSARAVRALAAEMGREAAASTSGIPGLEIWAVGPATARVARAHGFPPDRVPATFTGPALLEMSSTWRALDGLRLLFPRSERGWEGLPNGLRAEGAMVELVASYRITAATEGADRLLGAARAGEVDAVPLTAGSGADSLAGAMDRTGDGGWPTRTPIVAIGPATRRRAEAAGLPVRSVASPHTLPALVAEVRRVLHEG